YVPRFATLLAFSVFALAQQAPTALTSADYANAEKFMGYNTTPLVFGASGRPGWLDDGRFWYRVQRVEGPEFVIVDPEKGGARAPEFDHNRLAAGLTAATGTTVERTKLPFQTIEFSGDSKTLFLSVTGKRWACALDTYRCGSDTRQLLNSVLSPDKKK